MQIKRRCTPALKIVNNYSISSPSYNYRPPVIFSCSLEGHASIIQNLQYITNLKNTIISNCVSKAPVMNVHSKCGQINKEISPTIVCFIWTTHTLNLIISPSYPVGNILSLL